MKKHFVLVLGSALASVAFLASSAAAEVTFDPATGTGFVGKGDVQSVFGWNNEDLQMHADDVSFRYAGTETSTTTWMCEKDNGNQQERTRITISTTAGEVASQPRTQQQVSGFLLTGFVNSSSEEASTDGPKLRSCPAKWSLVGEPTISREVQGGGLQVSVDGETWHSLG